MELTRILERSVSSVMSRYDESEEFQERFKQLIGNYIVGSYTDDDVRTVLSLVKVLLPGEDRT
jgi:hypothetical protein